MNSFRQIVVNGAGHLNFYVFWGGRTTHSMFQLKRDTHQFLLNFCFVLFMLLILFNRYRVFQLVNMYVIDSDQPFMWIGATDFSQFKFYEPRFYGQDYNTFMEALVAVPLLWLKVPVYRALPLATHFIALFPFLFSAVYLFKKNRKEIALLVMGILICMPAAYDVVTAIPRGFVTGLFFCSFYAVSVLNPANLRYLAFNTVMGVFAYFINPNSLVVTAPFLAYLFFMNYRDKKYYAVTGLSLLSFIPFHFLFNQFYINHPEYVIYGLKLGFRPQEFFENLKSLPDKGFAHLGFFTEEHGFFLLAGFLLLAVWLWKKNRPAFFSLLVCFLLIGLSCLFDKTRDGSESAFYSPARMFLGLLPVMYLLAASTAPRSKTFSLGLVVIVTTYFCFKQKHLPVQLEAHTDNSRWAAVGKIKLKEALDVIKFYKQVANEKRAPLIVCSSRYWLSTYITYGGPSLYADYPATIEVESERRYYIRNNYMQKVSPRFLFLSDDFNIDKKVSNAGFSIQRLDDYGMFLVSDNTLTLRRFNDIVLQIETENKKQR